MAKQSRKKRKELAATGKMSSAIKQERRKSPNEEGYVSRRLQQCWNHKYQMDNNGEYVCSNCHYRTKDISAELALKDYFSLKNHYKVSEIKELMRGIYKVSWYRNTRGQRIEGPIEGVRDVKSVIENYTRWDCIWEINEDGSFPELKLPDNIKKIDRKIELNDKPEDLIERLEAEWIMDGVTSGHSLDDDLEMELWSNGMLGRKRLMNSSWYYENEDGKIYVYIVWRYVRMEPHWRDYAAGIKSPWLYVSLNIYSENKKLEKIIAKSRFGEIYSLVE